MAGQIIILDYNCGNIQSVLKKVERIGYSASVTSDPQTILRADKLILPGVGHFGNAMEQLRSLNLIDALNEAVLVKKTPILGICLGMQLMAERSEEGNSTGLGWIKGEVVRFNMEDKLNFKVPHMGWNSVRIAKNSALMNNIDQDALFYFVHSYYFRTEDSSLILNQTTYDIPFVSAFEQDNIFGVQYHPEKSHQTGEQLIKNFLAL